MKIKSTWAPALRLRRAAVMAGVVGLTAGAFVLTGASAALAANGSEPGNLTLNPPGSPSSPAPIDTKPTWSTSDACPSGFQGSAYLVEFNTDGSFASIISPVEQPATSPFTNEPTVTGGTVGALLGVTDITPGGTVEWSVRCFQSADAVPPAEYVQSTFLTETADGTGYFISGTGPQQTSTTTTLSVSPNPASVGDTVTLTATEVAADGTNPPGNVQFEVGGTDLGSPVAVDSTGTATLSTSALTAAAGTESLQAQFQPTSTGYASSISPATSLVVNPSGTQTAGGNNPVSITVSVPQTGTLTVNVAAGTVSLAVQGTQPPLTATGTLNQVTVTDTRNYVPGWSVSGQVTQPFTGSGSASGSTFSGDQLGWVPTAVGSLQGGATLGPTVTAGSNPGLGDAPQVLASAAPSSGTGTNVLSADLTLDIPDSALAGPYTALLTVTYLLTGP